MRRKSRWDFWERVAKAGYNDCWNWLGYKTRQGYGRITAERQNWWVHRLAYEGIKGVLPAWSTAAEVQHSCNNPSCCNPVHLWLGPRKDNMQTAGEQGTLSRKGTQNGNAKLTPAQVNCIRQDERSPTIVGKEYGVTRTQISNIRNRKHWRSVCE